MNLRYAWGGPNGRAAALLVALAAAMTLGVAFLPNTARAIVVLPTALLLPGYALVAAILGAEGRDRALDLALASIVSVATYALAAVALYALSVRLSASNLLVAVDGLVLLAVTVLLARVIAAGRVPRGAAWTRSDWRKSLRALAFFAMAAAAVPGFIAVVRVFPAPSPTPFTEFSLSGDWSRLSGPAQVGKARRVRVELQLRNETTHPQAYQITPSLDGGGQWASRRLQLAAGESWSGSVAGRIGARRCSQRLTLALDTIRPARPVTKLAVELQRPQTACVAPGKR